MAREPDLSCSETEAVTWSIDPDQMSCTSTGVEIALLTLG
jgi:hypothetical protein